MRILAILFVAACATDSTSTMSILRSGDSCPLVDDSLQADGDDCDHAEDCQPACCLCTDHTILGDETRDHVVASCNAGTCDSQRYCPHTCGGL
jgi:hypothetical protein